jgi:hypothetical protein
MRVETALILLLAVGSAGASGFVVGVHHGRRASDIPTRQETLEAMADEVGLDQDQRAKVRAVSDRFLPRMLGVRASVASEIAAIRSETRAETRAVMNPEQQARFDAYCARRDEQRRRADQ